MNTLEKQYIYYPKEYMDTSIGPEAIACSKSSQEEVLLLYALKIYRSGYAKSYIVEYSSTDRKLYQNTVPIIESTTKSIQDL